MEWSWGMSEYSECSNFQSSHRFNKIQQDSTKKSVQICANLWMKKTPIKSIKIH